MKNIYLILTYTGTPLSKIIRSCTKDEFSHVSIALDRELNEMFSFGRTQLYNPLSGGFVHENINSGMYKRFNNTKTKIYSFEITDDQYLRIENKLKRMDSEKEIYKFNRLGLLAVGFNKKVKKRENRYYCAEFIKELIEDAKIETSLPRIVRPENFKNLDGVQEIYSGLLRNYNASYKVEL